MNLINKESDYELNIYTYTFLVDIWLNFPILFSNNEEKTMFFISKLKKSCQKGQLESTSTLGNMFKLLEYLGHTRNSYAPMIYKTITFILIDNNENILIRSFIFSNISIILLQIESMPIGIFIDPWIKQIQISDSENNSIYIWNMTDFEFLKFISENNKLSTKNVIQIIDILAKVYLNNHIYAYCSLDILLILIRKFHFDDLVQEFLIKLSKIALAIYFASKKKRFSDKTKQKKEKYNLKTLFSSDFSETDLQTISMQKNALIVRLLTEIAKLNNEKISEKLKPLIAHTNLQLKKQILKTNDRGMMELLSYWGSPDKLLTKYETEYYESIAQEKIKKKEEELKKQMGETGLSNLSLNIDPNISKIELENSALEGRSINVGDPFKEGELASIF